MEYLVYDTLQLSAAEQTLTSVLSQYNQTLASFASVVGNSQAEIASDAAVSTAANAAIAAAQAQQATLQTLLVALSQINALYTKANQTAEDCAQELRGDLALTQWVAGGTVYFETEQTQPTETTLETQETTALYNLALDVPDWLMERIVAQAKENGGS